MSHVAYEKIEYVGTAPLARLVSQAGASATSWVCDDLTGWPTGGGNGRFWVVANRSNSNEEKAIAASRSGNTITFDDVSDRGEDGTTAATHEPGTIIEHVASASDLSEANAVVRSTVGAVTTKGDLTPATSSGVLGRLAAGSNGLPLVAASGETTGLQYAALSATGLASNAVTTAKILDANVTTAKINDSAVTSAKIADGTIATGDLADGAVTAAKIAAAVAGSGLAGGAGSALSVGVDDSTVEISGDAVRVKDGGITSAKIAAGTVAVSDVADAALPRWMITGFTAHLGDVGTATQMLVPVQPSAGSTSLAGGQAPIVVTEAGSIIGVSVATGGSRTSGSMVFEVYKNGSGTGLTATINGTNTQYAYGTQSRGSDTFVAGDRLDIRATNSSLALSGSQSFVASIVCSA